MEKRVKAAEALGHYLGQVKGLNYDHPEGARYAYVKLLSITRDLLLILQPVSALTTQVRDIQSINWLINQHLGLKFNEQQRIIFESKRSELTAILHAVCNNIESLNAIILPQPQVSIYQGM
jgi:hypothetical protein